MSLPHCCLILDARSRPRFAKLVIVRCVYCYQVLNDHSDLTITVTPLSGNPQLYVTNKVCSPSNLLLYIAS